ncbi:hypothetical protein [Halovibrio sp. HP20-50]|uniref:hypothetical protein n=1 Tax=Halovibrio sp. HP20-59 TaxID=3080275 RepID=UPI00294AEBC9|nr:hypothetical protein [Halovibrio sp. HP20-59]
MIEILKEFVFLVPYVTSFGVAIAMIQLWRTATQAVTTFEDSISKEYREITRRIPYKALVGIDMSDNEKAEALNEIYNYMDLCNEQIFLRKAKRVRRSTWNDWQEGMRSNFGLPFFSETSEEIMRMLPKTFNELRRVRDTDYSTDPGKW